VTDSDACSVCDALARARAGDAAAFSTLVRQHQRAVYTLAVRMLSDRHKAEDLAQEVFIRLHRKLALMQSDTHLRFWLRQVTSRLAIDRLRREPRHKLVPLTEDLPLAAESTTGDPMLQRQLRALIAQLPASARAVVLLRYQEDLDPSEIARTLEMPINTVKSHLKRSLEQLRERLTGATVGAASGRGATPL
jgi:RNA polymerase sigma-70 factor (ECF subfamily)